MAATKLDFSSSTYFGSLLHTALNQNEASFNNLNAIKGSLELMIDGDPSDPNNYTMMAAALGCSNATAKAVYDEIQALLFKLNTDSSVDNVHAALVQAFSKLR